MTPRELIGRRQSCYFANSQSSIFDRDEIGGSSAGMLIGSGGGTNLANNKNALSNTEILNGGSGIPGDTFPSAAAELRSRGDGKGVKHTSGMI